MNLYWIQVEFPEARIYEETLNILLYEHRPGPDADLMQATSTAKGAAAAAAAAGATGGNSCAAAYASDEEETETAAASAAASTTSSTRRAVNASLARLRLT